MSQSVEMSRNVSKCPKFGRNPKSDRAWKDRKKIEISKKDRKIEKRSKDLIEIEVQIEIKLTTSASAGRVN